MKLFDLLITLVASCWLWKQGEKWCSSCSTYVYITTGLARSDVVFMLKTSIFVVAGIIDNQLVNQCTWT